MLGATLHQPVQLTGLGVSALTCKMVLIIQLHRVAGGCKTVLYFLDSKVAIFLHLRISMDVSDVT